MIGRRQMTMISVWKIRTLLSAARAARKRQRIGDVELICNEQEDPDPAKDLKTYIALHQVLMVAYARARVKAIEPAPAGPEKASSDTTDFVQIPLDVAMAYHFRLVKFASAVPFSVALPNIVRRDEEERAWWTDRVRTSELSVGKIIREGLQTREVMWSPPPPPASGQQRPQTGSGPGQKTGGKGAQLGDRLKDGTQVCRKFNAGECSEPCPRGYKHVCSVVLNKTGRLCGMANHCALKCTRTLGALSLSGEKWCPGSAGGSSSGFGTPGVATCGAQECGRWRCRLPRQKG